MPIETTEPTQDTLAEMLIKLWPRLEENWKAIAGGAGVIVVVVGVYYYMQSQREENEQAAGAALTQLMMTPPSGVNPAEALTKLATTYAGTVAGQRAQLQAGATDFSTAHFAEAQAIFEKFVSENGSSPLVATAKLGIGASLEAQGKLDLAAAAYQTVASTYASTPSAVPAMCGLGRIAEAQGKLKEALGYYDSAARASGMGGTLAQEAQMRAAELRPKVAALTPAPATPAAAPGMSTTPVTIPAAK
ncbi:MAG: tetratricopeptide repeat protein [Verrucomicrobiae bacterium]|nr:tetratricopeptide repeat protein [Verrucomicrobiae bacterium]